MAYSNTNINFYDNALDTEEANESAKVNLVQHEGYINGKGFGAGSGTNGGAECGEGFGYGSSAGDGTEYGEGFGEGRV